MQEQMDAMSVEMQRRDASLSIINGEKERLQEQIRDLQGKMENGYDLLALNLSRAHIMSLQ